MQEPSKKEWRMLFFWGFAIGLLCFFVTYGTSVLSFTNDGWLFRSDTDLKQHYLGWCHFRTSPWAFPMGMIDSLSYPTSVSVIYTDSIPLFALAFKLFRSVLPETFQYFGLFAFLSFGLQGAISAVLLRRFTNNRIICMIMPVVFVWAFPMLHRTFYHTSLCAQWLILLSFYLWFSGLAKKKIWTQILIFGGMGILCTLIHSYFLPMVACILCGSLLQEFLETKEWKKSIPPLLSFGFSALLILVLLGAFSGQASADYGVGEFGMNLNSFFNSLGYGRILPAFPLYFETQYEGFAYLGMGVILAVIIGGILFIQSEKKANQKIWKGHPTRISLLVVSFVFLIVSVFPDISLNGKLFLHVPYTRQMTLVIGIFRSNGRFIWPVLYLLTLLGAVLLPKILNPKAAAGIVLVCTLVQVFDVSSYVLAKRNHFDKEPRKYISDWDFDELNQVVDQYHHFVLLYDNNSIAMTTAYYAYYHDMTLNRFYYARNIDHQIEMTQEMYEQELANEKPEKDCIYVMNQEKYNQYQNSGLHFYRGESCIFATADAIPGLSELLKEEIEEIEWE